MKTMVAAGTLVALASPLAAQTQERMQFQSPGSTVAPYGVYVGPYTAKVLSQPGMPTIDIFCVDFANSIGGSEIWDANWTRMNSGDFGSTRIGQTQGNTSAELNYKKAAWLSSQFDQTNTNDWAAIHAAIWHLTTPGQPSVSGNLATQTAFWTNEANKMANYNTINLANWVVVTDVRSGNAAYGGNKGKVLGGQPPNGPGQGGVQEYLTHSVVPEPFTITLLGTGLAGLGLARRRKKAELDA